MDRFFRSDASVDKAYCIMRDGMEEHHVNGREHFEHVWSECCQYVDSDAAEKATRDLAPVFGELQLAYALKSAGKCLAPRRASLGSKTTRDRTSSHTGRMCGLKRLLSVRGPARTPFRNPK